LLQLHPVPPQKGSTLAGFSAASLNFETECSHAPASQTWPGLIGSSTPQPKLLSFVPIDHEIDGVIVDVERRQKATPGHKCRNLAEALLARCGGSYPVLASALRLSVSAVGSSSLGWNGNN